MSKKCNSCNPDSIRLYLPNIEFTDSQYGTIKQTLLTVGEFHDIQAEGTIVSLKMQRMMLRSKIISSVSDSIIYSGEETTAKKLQEALHVQGIRSYIQTSKDLIK
jgi:hypothetical protein